MRPRIGHATWHISLTSQQRKKDAVILSKSWTSSWMHATCIFPERWLAVEKHLLANCHRERGGSFPGCKHMRRLAIAKDLQNGTMHCVELNDIPLGAKASIKRAQKMKLPKNTGLVMHAECFQTSAVCPATHQAESRGSGRLRLRKQ